MAELTASSRLTGACVVLADSVLEGRRDVVPAVVESASCVVLGDAVLEGRRDVVPAVVGSGLSDVGDGCVAVAKGRVAEGSAAARGSTARERDLSSRTSKVSRTTLTKTNPPMATFGQWPFEMSGMRRSLTGKPRTVAVTGQRRTPVTVAHRSSQRPPRRHSD